MRVTRPLTKSSQQLFFRTIDKQKVSLASQTTSSKLKGFTFKIFEWASGFENYLFEEDRNFVGII
jgi:hypothetical protein